ncbi:hypothetical protein [Marinivivus vitaminiproducens]|uniref:hypothetical protein n=1 Tax=Marinivivus vitaminiproducens TaxID=3035935 RepID=UPI0027A69995|nr:hypothetical protein P4R82_05445 [Geminicoccaceae bacterium SCSIO 64248]
MCAVRDGFLASALVLGLGACTLGEADHDGPVRQPTASTAGEVPGGAAMIDPGLRWDENRGRRPGLEYDPMAPR